MKQPVFRRSGNVLVLRAAAMPMNARPAHWPAVDSVEACRQWLAEVWNDDTFVGALRAASPRLVDYTQRILAGDGIEPKRIRKAVGSVASYTLRATGRATPFGLFAGVALAGVGTASASFGTTHQAVARPDTLWVHHTRTDLERRPDVLPHLIIQVNTLASQRGDTISAPRSRGRLASARITRPLSVLLRGAAEPTTGRELLELEPESKPSACSPKPSPTSTSAAAWRRP